VLLDIHFEPEFSFKESLYTILLSLSLSLSLSLHEIQKTSSSLIRVKSSQVTFIYIALFTIEIVSKQLHSDNMKVVQHRSIILLNIK